MKAKKRAKIIIRTILIKIPFLWKFLYKRRYILLKNRARKWLANQKAQGKPWRINIGSSNDQYPGWLATEEQYLDLLKEHTWLNLFDKPDSVDAMLSEHVWEHLSQEHGEAAARMCFKYLKPGGYLRAAVPDGFTPIPEYIEAVRVGGTGPAADGHLMLYNYKTFSEVFAQAGFEIKLLEYNDENGEFHYTPWNPEDGMIRRSKYGRGGTQGPFDHSIVLDAIKPKA